MPVELLSKYCTETEKQWKVQDQDGFISELCNMIPKNCSVPLRSVLEWQNEYLGYISYTNPKLQNIGFVLNLDTRYSPKASIYMLSTGETVTVKVSKQMYQKQPFDSGNILKFYTEDRPRSIRVNNEWQKDYSQMEKWISNYAVVQTL